MFFSSGKERKKSPLDGTNFFVPMPGEKERQIRSHFIGALLYKTC